MSKGKLIVLEGLDGSGKGTQAQAAGKAPDGDGSSGKRDHLPGL